MPIYQAAQKLVRFNAGHEILLQAKKTDSKILPAINPGCTLFLSNQQLTVTIKKLASIDV